MLFCGGDEGIENIEELSDSLLLRERREGDQAFLEFVEEEILSYSAFLSFCDLICEQACLEPVQKERIIHGLMRLYYLV